MTTHQKSLGDRMKEYENVTDTTLYRRMPVILRLDGRAFHTLTSFMEDPFDEDFISLMNKTMLEVFESLPDAMLGYVESDEISILLCPYGNYDTEPVFSARIQKLCSVVASMATQAFIKELYERLKNPETADWASECLKGNITFDCRCFNLTKEEVGNYFLWRQQDCKRNSVLSAAQTFIGKKKILGLKAPELIDKMLNEKNIDYWKAIPRHVHYGRSCFRGSNGTEIKALNFEMLSFKEGLKILINFNYEENYEYSNFFSESN